MFPMRAVTRRKKSGAVKGRRYGGRATAEGVAYESRIAASIAVTMSCGARSIVTNLSNAATAAKSE